MRCRGIEGHWPAFIFSLLKSPCYVPYPFYLILASLTFLLPAPMLSLKNIYLLFNYVCVYVYVLYAYVWGFAYGCRLLRRPEMSDSVKLNLQVLWPQVTISHLMWVLGIELRSFGRTIYVLSHSRLLHCILMWNLSWLLPFPAQLVGSPLVWVGSH